MIQRAESDLSVKPISTCLAPAGHPRIGKAGVRGGAALAISNASVSPAMPAAARRSCTATAALRRAPSVGRSHSGSGIRSILRRFSRSDDDQSFEAARRQALDGELCRTRQSGVLLTRLPCDA